MGSEENEQRKYVISKVSPHSKAIYESGKKLLNDSIDNGKDFCKTMITICTGISSPLFRIDDPGSNKNSIG
jgi:hypothetical protein